MLCQNCQFEWPNQVNRCPFCGDTLHCERLGPDAEVLALDLAVVGLKSLMPRITMAKSLPAKAKATAGVARTLMGRMLKRPSWTPIYTSDQVYFAHISHLCVPARISEALSDHVASLERLGFTRLGDGVVPQRLGPPYVTAFSNPSIPCVGQISSFRPGLPGGVNSVLFETRFSDGVALITSNTPTLKHALGPWINFCYLPRHSTSDLLDVHVDRLKAQGDEHGQAECPATIEQFAESAVAELTRWFKWALSTGICVRLKASECHT